MRNAGPRGKLPDWSMALDGLDEAQRQQIDACFSRRSVAEGALVFRQGDRGDTFSVIESGRVRLFHTSEDGKEYVSGQWSSGYPLGLISAVLQERRLQAVQVIDRVVLRAMRRADLVALMAAMPAFSVNVSRLLASMARYSIVRSGPLALDSSAARLGRVMAGLATREREGPDTRGHAHVIRGLRQDELARMVGASRPWVTLTLASFERQGLITRRRGQIEIIDISQFQRYFPLSGDD